MISKNVVFVMILILFFDPCFCLWTGNCGVGFTPHVILVNAGEVCVTHLINGTLLM